MIFNYYQKNKSRVWQIDLLRGIAVIAMVCYNSLSLLNFFDLIVLQINSMLWTVLALIIASTFILLSGFSMTLSHKKHNSTLSNITRGVQILFYGFIVTIVSWFVSGGYPVVFGILHFIGLGKIISSPFVKFKKINIILGALIISLGIALQNIVLDTPLLVWLGIRYIGYRTLDYFPIFPWLGVMLIGVALGNIIYPSVKKVLIKKKPNAIANTFCFLGRHSLLIYFLHVIVILSIVFFSKH